MSTVNHLPRACSGPGKRPGISAPGGRHLNSISLVSPLGFSAHTSTTAGSSRSPVFATELQREHLFQGRQVFGVEVAINGEIIYARGSGRNAHDSGTS